jgi:hypothetical protein
MWYHVRARLKTIEVIGPRLHHLATLIKPSRSVVRRSHFVALLVREL